MNLLPTPFLCPFSLALPSLLPRHHTGSSAPWLIHRYGVIKVCDEFPGFTRFKQHQPFGASSSKRISVPRSHAKHPTDTYPDQSQRSIERAVKAFLPQFADRPLFNKAMCWCTDTADAALLICEHPRWRNFFLATGDSGYVVTTVYPVPILPCPGG